MKVPLLTPKQRAFVDQYVTCRNGAEAARRAGYSAPSARITASMLLTKNNIKVALAAAEAKLKRKLDIDKATVIGELRAAIEVAREGLDAASMIRAWVEISKMLGIYAPVAVRVAVSPESGAQCTKYEQLSDEELLRIVAG